MSLSNSIPPNSASAMATTAPLDPIVVLTIPISTKLNRSNFLAWKSQITLALHGHDLFHFLTDDPPAEKLSVNGVLTTNPKFSHWRRQDQLILTWLRSSLSDTILGQVVSCDTSADLWKALQQSFSATSRARLSQLRRSFQTTTKGGLTCVEYCQKLRAIADELAFVGFPVSDDDLVLQVLGGLGSDFNSFVVAANTKDHLSFSELQAMLQSHENLINSQTGGDSSSLPSSQNPVAYYTNYRSGPSQHRSGPSKPGKGGYRQQQRSYPTQPPLLPNPNSRPSFPIGPVSSRPVSNKSSQSQPSPFLDRNSICQICFKRGH